MGPVQEPLADNFGLVARNTILQEVCCLMLCNEELRFVCSSPHSSSLPCPATSDPMASPAEAGPGHDLGRMLHRLLGGPEVVSIRSNWPACAVHTNPELKRLTSKKRDFFRSLTPQFLCLLANSSLWFFMLFLRNSFLAIFMEGRSSSSLQTSWMVLTSRSPAQES